MIKFSLLGAGERERERRRGGKLSMTGETNSQWLSPRSCEPKHHLVCLFFRCLDSRLDDDTPTCHFSFPRETDATIYVSEQNGAD